MPENEETNMLKALWDKISPYFTVERVTIAVTSILTPPLAIFAGWLSTKLAQVGYNPDPAQLTGVFIAGVVALVAVVVPIVRAYMTNRTETAKALIAQNRPDLVGAKSIQAQIKAQTTSPATDPNQVEPPEPPME